MWIIFMIFTLLFFEVKKQKIRGRCTTPDGYLQLNHTRAAVMIAIL